MVFLVYVQFSKQFRKHGHNVIKTCLYKKYLGWKRKTMVKMKNSIMENESENTLRLHINSLTTNAPAQDIYMLSTYFSNMLHFSKAVNLFLVINMLGLWKFGDSFLICLSILTVIFTCT